MSVHHYYYTPFTEQFMTNCKVMCELQSRLRFSLLADIVRLINSHINIIIFLVLNIFIHQPNTIGIERLQKLD